MKKITLLFLAFLAVNLTIAQDTCTTAIAVSAGTITVGPINGTLPDPDCAPNVGLNPRSAGEWYSYTPAS
ncbi:MAG: hypothetical protein HRU26_07620, partial [Psychroserpens sp.]|nr:hypothetical protein [Psychroserpens sp.]